MAALKKFIKDPNATLDYTFDWEDFLEDQSDTISSATFIVPTGLTKTNESTTDTTATVWLSGGTVGTKYSVVCRITTVGGRIDDRTIEITIREK